MARACAVGTRCYLSLLADADLRLPLFLQVTAWPHRALGQLPPAQSRSQPPLINLTHCRIHRSKASVASPANSTPSRNHASAPDNAHVPALSHIPPQDGMQTALWTGLFPGMGPDARGWG